MTKEPVLDVSLGDVWRTRLFQQSRRGSADDVSDEGGRTVPSEYYSRHNLLRPESPPSYVMPPNRGRKVFSFRPGTVQQDQQKGWPSRAHDGSTEQQRVHEEGPRK
ncbi:hypothetical protein JTE90_021322 [Oedothorax gibbosus]|uniref:Uncharacterized protein n=1 Tax=Oedothorax gibbosus TaxID=931172 RepID=A0AAV6VLB9_9ARAC|nr:hypothetical protein JTE90_021322 [Oedothorax gibbosus]